MKFRFFIAILGAFSGINEIAHAQLKSSTLSRMCPGAQQADAPGISKKEESSSCNECAAGCFGVAGAFFAGAAVVSTSIFVTCLDQNKQLDPYNNPWGLYENSLMFEKSHIVAEFSSQAAVTCTAAVIFFKSKKSKI